MKNNNMESKLKLLLKNGWTYVKGAKAYHELAAYAEQEGYMVSEGRYLPGSMKIVLNLEVAE